MPRLPELVKVKRLHPFPSVLFSEGLKCLFPTRNCEYIHTRTEIGSNHHSYSIIAQCRWSESENWRGSSEVDGGGFIEYS